MTVLQTAGSELFESTVPYSTSNMFQNMPKGAHFEKGGDGVFFFLGIVKEFYIVEDISTGFSTV